MRHRGCSDFLNGHANRRPALKCLGSRSLRTRTGQMLRQRHKDGGGRKESGTRGLCSVLAGNAVPCSPAETLSEPRPGAERTDPARRRGQSPVPHAWPRARGRTGGLRCPGCVLATRKPRFTQDTRGTEGARAPDRCTHADQFPVTLIRSLKTQALGR